MSALPYDEPHWGTYEDHELRDGAPEDPEAMFALDVAREAHRLRVREAARDLVAAEQAPPSKPFDAGTLGELLGRPPEPPYRAESLIPSDAGTLLVAQRKTGKTTLLLNLARAMIEGTEFLREFSVRPVAGRVAFLNFEVSGATLARWAEQVGVPAERLFVVNLRGRRNPFAHPDDLAALAKLLRDQGTESVLVDPFGRAYSGLSQNDPGEVGAWLARLDEFARGDVGARDVVLAAHAGWNGERTRGSSALEDWADSVVTLTKDDEGVRYLRAIGRDVDLDEDALGFDSRSRELYLTGAGSRHVANDERAVAAAKPLVAEYLAAYPGASGADIEKGVDRSRVHVRAARRALVAVGLVIEDVRRGKGGGKSYRLNTQPRPSSPNPASGGPGTSPTSPLRGEVPEARFENEPRPTSEPTTWTQHALDEGTTP